MLIPVKIQAIKPTQRTQRAVPIDQYSVFKGVLATDDTRKAMNPIGMTARERQAPTCIINR